MDNISNELTKVNKLSDSQYFVGSKLMRGSVGMVLSEVKQNGFYHVVQVHALGDVHRHLEDLGFLPGEVVQVVSRIGGNLLVNVKGSRIALSAELAKKIVV